MTNNELTKKILESEQLFNFNNENKLFLIDKNKIILAFENLRKIIFPKYFIEDKNINFELYLETLINETFNILTNQISLVIDENFIVDTDSKLNLSIFEKAKLITEQFMEKLPVVTKTLISDIEATFSNDPAAESKSQIIFSYPGITAITFYRLAHELRNFNIPFIPRIVTEYAHSLTGIDIHPGATIGNSFCIDHGTGIVIGETTIIGDNVKIYQGVTLGALSIKNRETTINKKRHPTIENNVTLYAGCTVLGGLTVIGENSIIGGSTFIVKSIPKNTLVSMELPKLNLKTHNQI